MRRSATLPVFVRRRPVVPSALALAGLCACAGIQVERATDTSQGIPFYLQRPYVVVLEEFPVEGEQGYILADYDPSTGSISLRGLNTSLSQRLGVQTGERFPLSAIFYAGEPDAGQGTLHADVESPDTPTAPAEPETEAGESQVKEELSIKAQGIAKWDSTVPDSIDINDKFKITFLPDLDEKYVINPKAGVGTADLSVATGPGGILNQFQIQIDNSEVGRFLMETARTAVSLAEKAAEMELGMLHSLAEEDLPTTRSTITLRYTYVGYAMPGMYPVLKESEYKDHVRVAGSTADAYLIPAEWPYTRFAFKVRRTMMLEAVGLGSANARVTPQLGRSAAVDNRVLERQIGDGFVDATSNVTIGEETVVAKFVKARLNTPGDTVSLLFEIPADANATFTGLGSDEQNAIQAAALAPHTDRVDAAKAQFEAVRDATFRAVLTPPAP